MVDLDVNGELVGIEVLSVKLREQGNYGERRVLSAAES